MYFITSSNQDNALKDHHEDTTRSRKMLEDSTMQGTENKKKWRSTIEEQDTEREKQNEAEKLQCSEKHNITELRWAGAETTDWNEERPPVSSADAKTSAQCASELLPLTRTPKVSHCFKFNIRANMGNIGMVALIYRSCNTNV